MERSRGERRTRWNSLFLTSDFQMPSSSPTFFQRGSESTFAVSAHARVHIRAKAIYTLRPIIRPRIIAHTSGNTRHQCYCVVRSQTIVVHFMISSPPLECNIMTYAFSWAQSNSARSSSSTSIKSLRPLAGPPLPQSLLTSSSWFLNAMISLGAP